MAGGSTKVSVVIPVFNTEVYLPKCLDSILGQTLREIEIICVDDGSTDGSWGILRDYARADNRVKLIRQQNQYAGVARNNGMDHATGTYVVFCDSDDYIAPNALQLMYEQCERDAADVCVCGGKRFYEQFGLTVDAPGYLEKKRIPDVLPFNRHTNAEHIFSFTTIMTWNKMFRLDFLREHQLRYDSTRNGEDVFICALALWLAERITVVREPLVVYRVGRPNSLVSTLSQSALDPLRAWMKVWRAIGGEFGASKRSFDCKVLGVMRHGLRNVNTLDAFNTCYDYIVSDMIDEIDLRVRPEGYYYTPWYNPFVEALRTCSREEFAVYLIFAASRELEGEEARKLDFRHSWNECKSTMGREIRVLTKELTETKRKFSKVEWAYRAGRAALWPARKIKSLRKGSLEEGAR